jgi:hypothetical protein
MRASRINYPGFSLATHPSVLALLETTCCLTLEYLLHPCGPTLLSLEGQISAARHGVARSISLIVSSGRSSTLRYGDVLYILTVMALASQKYALQLRADDLADGVSAHAAKVQFNRPTFFSTIFLAFTLSAVLKPSSRVSTILSFPCAIYCLLT